MTIDKKDIEGIQSAIETTSTELKAALATQADTIEKHGKSTVEASERVVKAEKALDEVTKAAGAIETRLTAMETAANRSGVGGSSVKSLGQQFIESEIFKAVSASGHGNEVPFFEQKAISNDAASAGGLTQEFQNPQIFANPDRSTFIRDLVNHTPVQTDAVKVVRETAFTNAAAPQAGQLAAKAESNITFTPETYPVQTVAHWIAASRQILADAPRLRSFIDQRLMYGLDLKMDKQLLLGDGTGENFTGIMVDTSVQDAGASAAMATTTWLDHIRSAITKCQVSEYYNINGVVLNPVDWEKIELSKGSDGHYIWVSVPNGGESRLWKMPVVVTNAMTAGSFVIGDWTMGATLYDREQKSVRISEQNIDNFVKNAVTILAEERAAFAIELPLAFTKGTLTAAA